MLNVNGLSTARHPHAYARVCRMIATQATLPWAAGVGMQGRRA
ncbi:MAG TPA: hypothetical protein VH592_06655 [Gemmataceae bacterium]|jgi:hypothetical protein